MKQRLKNNLLTKAIYVFGGINGRCKRPISNGINRRGVTLLETLIYLALFAVVVSLVSVSAQQALSLYSYAKIRGGVSEQARQAAFLIKREIKNASGIYTPTSIFGSNPGQLSLETTINLPADESSTFVDFYIDDNRLFIKREGLDPELLIGGQYIVPRFIVTNLNTIGTTSAVRIELTVTGDSDEAGLRFGSTTITTSASLRAY